VVTKLRERYTRDGSEFDRAIAFIDATFALALTLLVTTLDLSSRPSDWSSLGEFYDAMGTQLLAFAIAFVVISAYWLSHYRIVAACDEIDLGLIIANLVLVATVVIVPFTTESVGDPAINDLPLPTALLAVNAAAVCLAFTLVYVVARRRGALHVMPTQREFAWNLVAFTGPTVVFLVSIPIAYGVSPVAAQLSWLTLLVVNPLLGQAGVRARRSSAAA
jgi:uncharacterized membrane protein